MQTKSNMIEVDSAKHTDAHSHGIMCAYWAAPSAVAARYLMHLSMDGCRSCRETLSAALLRGCYRTARAQLDLLRTPAISGHHQQRVVRPAALEQRAHSLRATVASLRRWLRCAGEASITEPWSSSPTSTTTDERLRSTGAPQRLVHGTTGAALPPHSGD